MALRKLFIILSCIASGLAGGPLSAATFTWAGTNTDWFNTNNWSPPGLPGSNDVANFNSGTISFSSPLTFAGQFNWNGGTLTGSPLTIATNGVLNINSGSTVSLWCALTNAGTVNWINANINADYSSSLNEFGVIVNLTGALFTIQSGQGLANTAASSGAFFQNAGTIRKTGGSGSTISIPFYNSGTVSNSQATLTFTKGGVIEGALGAAGGSSITFNSGAFAFTNTPVLAGSGTIQLTGGSLTLASNAIPNLQINGGTITLGPSFQGGTITNLTVVAGTLNGNNTVSGTLYTGATMPGSLTLLGTATVNWAGGSIQGPVNIPSGATLILSSNQTKFLWGALTNAGTVTWTGGQFEVDYTSAFGEFGLVQNQPGALWDIQCDNNFNAVATNDTYFQNSGTFRKSGTGGTTTIYLPFNNSGTVTNLSGTLRFAGGGNISGNFGAAGGNTIDLNAGLFSYTSTPILSGAGTIQFSGGTLTLGNNVVPNLQIIGGSIALGPNFQGGAITNLTFVGGAFAGNAVVSGSFTNGANMSGNITVQNGGTFNWTGGSISGLINVLPGGTMILSGNRTKQLFNALTNSGVLTWTGTGTWEVDYSSSKFQFGLIENLAGALIDCQNSQPIVNNSAANGAFLLNAGTFRKSADNNSTQIQIPFYNSGSVTGLQGTIQLSAGGIIQGGFNVAAGATVNFSGGPFSFTNMPVVTGPGLVELSGNASLTLPSNTVPNLQLLGGTVTLGPNFQGGTITDLAMSGGTLNGNNTVSGLLYSGANLTGSLTLLPGAAVNWAGGSIQGPITVPAGASLTISSNTSKYLWGALTNAGTVTWGGTADLEVDYSSASGEFGNIINLPGALFDIQSNQRLFNGAPNGAFFQNAGTLRKSSGTLTTTFMIPLLNTGTVNTLQGQLLFSGGGNLDGAFTAGAGSTINFSSGTFTYDAPPSLSGLGTIEITGGTLTLLNNVIPNLQLAGGAVTLGANFQGGIITNLTMTSGTLAGNNTVSGVFNTGANLTGSLTLLPGATVNWIGGSSIQGPIYVASGAFLNLMSGNTMHLLGALTNAGTVRWPGSGQLELDYSSAANEFGMVQNLPGALFDIQSSSTVANGFFGSLGASFQNAGTLRKLGDPGATTFNVPLNNTSAGTVIGGQGTLSFSSGGTIQGAFMAAFGAIIDFTAGAFSYVAPAPTVTGAGTVALTGGTLTLLNDIIANLQLQAGTVTLAPGFQNGAITNLTISGGTLLGNNIVNGIFNTAATLPGSLAIQGGSTVTWTGGSIQGPVTVASDASLNIAGVGTKFLWGPLTNSGTVTWTGGGNLNVDNSSSLGQSALIQNQPGGLFDIQNDETMRNESPNGAYFQNNGIFQKSMGLGSSVISIPFTNNGTAKALQATVNFGAGASLAGGTLVNGISSSGYGEFSITGPAALAGGLNVSWLGGFVPALSNSFTLVAYGSRTGTFSPFTVPSAAQWQSNYGPTALTLSVAEIDKLSILSGPTGTATAGATLAPLSVQVIDSVTSNSVPTNGLPVTAAIATGVGTLSGTVTRLTDPTGKATFNDLSINLAGPKTLSVSAGGIVPATNAQFSITAAQAAKLVIGTSIGATQQDGTAFLPAPAARVADAFGNVVSNSTATVMANSTSTGTGQLNGNLAATADGATGSAVFPNLFYSLGNPLAPETVSVYYTSPGLTPATNNPVTVNIVFSLITLRSSNSLIHINPLTTDGIYSWTVDGTNYLYQQWVWLREGSGAQFPVNLLGPPLGLAISQTNAVISYAGSNVTVTVGFALHGGVAGSGASDLTETISVQNTSNSVFSAAIFQYADFDLSTGGEADTVSFPTGTNVVQQGGHAVMTQVVQSPVPSSFEGSFYPLTFDKVTGNSPATLSDSVTPPSAGDQTFAFEWSSLLAPAQIYPVALTESIRPLAGRGPDSAQAGPAIVLTITAAGDNVLISWPASGADGAQLQTATGLETGDWSNVTNTPALDGQNYEVNLPLSSGPQFFRLTH